jgi:antitoxin component of MazEF toxin-antitoxin module
MATLTLQLSNESIVTLPAELARQVGLDEGDSVEAVVTADGLTIAPARDYAETWHVLESHLRYQAVALGLTSADRRDEAYWQIVEPMLQDMERDVSI